MGENPTKEKPKITRLLDNATTLENYAVHFGNLKMNYITTLKCFREYSGIIVNASPDMVVEYNRRKKLLKIEPVKDDLKGKPRIVTQLMFEAQEGMKIGLGEADIMLLCTKIGKIYCYDRSSSINILQAAKEIKEIWDSLPVPQVKKAS